MVYCGPSSSQDLESEKRKILNNLSAKEDETVKLSKERNNLSSITNNLQEDLSSIEQRSKLLQHEKLQFEERLVKMLRYN